MSPARRYRTVFSVVTFICEFVSLVESDAISISHFPHVPSLSPESSLGVISRNLLRSVLSIKMSVPSRSIYRLLLLWERAAFQSGQEI